MLVISMMMTHSFHPFNEPLLTVILLSTPLPFNMLSSSFTEGVFYSFIPPWKVLIPIALSLENEMVDKIGSDDREGNE